MLGVVGIPLYQQKSFVPVKNLNLKILRFLCVIVIYYSVGKDWSSLSQTIIYLRKRWDDLILYYKLVIIFYLIILRILVISFSEIISVFIIMSTDIESEGGMGPLNLLQNFVALVLILELDDIVMNSFVVHRERRRYRKSFLRIFVPR